MPNHTNNQADAIFTQHWNVYNKIIEYNHMFHRELAEEINRILVSLNSHDSLHILDLGCGDAALFSNLLRQHPVNSYTGYDTSAEVLKYADHSLKKSAFTYQLVNDYLQNATAIETKPFNCICSSFAIHHLSDEQKNTFFKEAYHRLLTPNGIFIYIDVLRKPEQPREEYLDAYIHNIKNNWTSLNQQELALVEDHIRNYDFPADKAQLKEVLTGIGFSVTEPLVLDNYHHILLLGR